MLDLQRIAGEQNIVPDDVTKYEIQRAAADQKTISVTAKIRVCLDEKGRVESVLPIEVSGFRDYDSKLMTHIHDWVYKPFLVDGQPVPICTYVRFRYNQK